MSARVKFAMSITARSIRHMIFCHWVLLQRKYCLTAYRKGLLLSRALEKCETCDIVVIYCAIKKEHVEHTHELVEKMASKRRSMPIAPVQEMIKKLSEAEDNISTQEKIREQASEIDQEIGKCYVELLKELNECHKKLKDQLHNTVSQKEEALNKQLRDMELVQDELHVVKTK